MKQVLFTVGEEEFGVDIFCVEAIERGQTILKIPTAPQHIGGIIQLRGEAIPVYDLRARFGRPVKNTDLLIISKVRGMKVAMAVDEVNEIIEADDNEVIQAPGLVKTDQTAFVSKVTNVKGHMFISLDFDGIITDEEKAAIDQMLKDR